MSYILAIFGFIILGVYVFFKKRYAYWKERGVPGPEPTFFFGNIGKAIVLNTMMSTICSDIYKEYKDYQYVGMFNFWTPAIVVRDAELVKNILIKQFNNFHDNWIAVSYKTDPAIAKNPFVMQGDEWKIVRTQLSSQYSLAKLKTLVPLIHEVGKNLSNYIKKQMESTKSNCFELKNLMARFTGENTLLCAYGLEGKSFTDDFPVAFQIGEQIASPKLRVQINQTIGLFFPKLRDLLKVTFLGSPIPKLFWDMILGTIKYREDNDVVRNDYLNFIKELKKLKNPPYEMNNGYAVAHAFTFFLDAFETSSLALTYALYELSLNPEIQSKARAEVDKVLEKHNGRLTHEELAELEYIDNILSETLRKHSIISFLSRICTEECQFPPPGGSGTGKDVTIEKGTLAFLSLDGIHNDPKYYPNPERFDPDRFTEAVKNARPKGCYLGFGDGPRMCLGRNFATTQIKVALAVILSEFEVRMDSKTKIPYERDLLQIFNAPKTEIFVNFHKRY